MSNICMLIIMHIFSIIVIMQIVKRSEESNGLFASTEGREQAPRS